MYSKDGIRYSEGSMNTYNFTKLSQRGYWYKPSDWKNVGITGEYNYRGGKGQGIIQSKSNLKILILIDALDESFTTFDSNSMHFFNIQCRNASSNIRIVITSRVYVSIVDPFNFLFSTFCFIVSFEFGSIEC